MSNQQQLNTLSNQDLLVSLRDMRATECAVIAEIVRYLAEIDTRQSYRDLGYSSLFAFCTGALQYSEGAAQRRIIAARCLKDNSEVYELLKSGKISLCSLSQVARVITPENKTEILTLAVGLPKEQAQRLAAQYAPATEAKRETIRAKKVLVVKEEVVSTNQFTATVTVTPTTEERFSISLEVDSETMELINDAKRYSGEIKLAALLKLVFKEYTDRKKPKAAAANKPVPAPNTNNTRYIPSSVKDTVRIRDNEQCTFVALDGTRCCEKVGLEFDHETPFSLGGTATVENLRLTCKAHNRLYAEQVFGREFMRRFSDDSGRLSS